jgi:hypothetical protein
MTPTELSEVMLQVVASPMIVILTTLDVLFMLPAGSVKANVREPKTGLGCVFNSKLGCIATPGSKCMVCMQPLLKL